MRIILLAVFLLASINCYLNNAKSKINNNNSYDNITKNISNSERQKNISSDFYKDNFDFEQFKSVDWNNTETYGTIKNLVKKSSHKYNIPIAIQELLSELDSDENDYVIVDILGDGNCWSRAAIQQILFLVLNDQEIFDNFIKQIPVIAKKYKNVEGFSQRFLANDLITLLNKLKNLNPKERLSCFNKDKVDNFLQYIFRTIIAADHIINQPNEKSSIKKLLSMTEWGDVTYVFDTIMILVIPNNKIWYNIDLNSKQVTKNFGLQKQATFTVNEKNQFSKLLDDGNYSELTKKEKKEILQYAKVQPIHMNKNHYNLLVNKKAVILFGLE